MVDEFPQAQMPGEGGRQEQTGIGHQAVIVKDDTDTVGIVLWQHLSGAPSLGLFCCYKTIIPDSEEHPLASSRAVPKTALRWIRAKASGGFHRWHIGGMGTSTSSVFGYAGVESFRLQW